MIDLSNGHLIRRGVQIAISGWQVWFQTPFGITPEREEAVRRCTEADIDPEVNVTPVPVALGSDGSNEVFYVRR